MLYRPETAEVNVPPAIRTIPIITGQGVARVPHRHRAGLAAQFYLDEMPLVWPTKSQMVAMLGVSEHQIRAQIEWFARAYPYEVRRGDPAVIAELSPADKLTRAWNEASPADRVEFARRVGVDAVWDGAVAPVIT
jgi:hypothetical protein